MFWYDGQLKEGNQLSLSVNDPGLLYGATVFTTLRVYQQSLWHPLTCWEAHCQRLRRSLTTFGWQLPDWERLRQGATQLHFKYPVLRMVIFADGREWIGGRFLPEDLVERQQKGVAGWVAEEALFRRSLAGYKTGNYLGAWLALQQAQKKQAKEAILIDEKGNWLETATGNLWGWQEDCWWTPPLDEGILPGIARSQLLNWLESQKIPVRERQWTPDFVRNLEVVAYSNCVMEIIPFSRLLYGRSHLISEPCHPALEQLRSYFAI